MKINKNIDKINKRYRNTLFLVLIILLFTACTAVRIEPRKYYILEYKYAQENNDLFASVPHTFSLRVPDSEIIGTYNRRQIVVRLSENQIMYDQDNLWADRLPHSIANLVHQRISRYNIFRRVIRDFQQRARYEVITIVNALEYLDNGSTFGARLSIEFQLRRTSDNLMVLQHKADRNRMLPTNDLELFVQTINDLLMEETDIFLGAFNYNYDQIEQGVEYSDQNFFTSNEFLADTQNAEYRLELIDESLLVIKGRLLVPVKTDSDHEPLYSLEDAEHNFIGSYEMGTEVHLDPGNYFVYIGNGTMSQQVMVETEVFPRYKTVLDADIGWLSIDIIDQNRNQVDHRYELFSLTTAESYGFAYGVREGVGQQLNTWVLQPGLYKVILNGEPFNAFRDFTTVEVKKGDITHYTVVIDEETKHLIGAGRTLLDDYKAMSRKLKASIINYLNANLSSKNDINKNENSTSITIIEQLDTRVIFETNPYHYTFKNLVEVGVSKETDSDIKIATDKFDIKNTLIYYFLQNIGLYGRADLNTHLFPAYIYTQEAKSYVKIDKNEIDSVAVSTDKLQVRDPFYPLVLKQGIGLNYRVLNKNRSSLNLRVGLGFRQDLNDKVYIPDRNDFDLDPEQGNQNIEIYRELESVYQEGIEFSANGNFQIFRDLNYTTTADLLKPFDSNMTETYEWENILNLRMFKYVSLDYKLNLSYNKTIRDYVLLDHSLFLRFTYIFLR